MNDELAPDRKDAPGNPNSSENDAAGATPPRPDAAAAGATAADESAPEHRVPPEGREPAGTDQEVEAARAEIARLKETVVRIQADMENLRKRAARDVENAHKYALERFVEDLLPVKDAIDLGVSAAGSATEVESLREGVEITAKMFDQMLEKIGVTEIDPEGSKFDPEYHQAMTMMESATEPPGTVVTVMQKGFALNGRLIRPAMVGVATAPKDPGQGG